MNTVSLTNMKKSYIFYLVPFLLIGIVLMYFNFNKKVENSFPFLNKIDSIESDSSGYSFENSGFEFNTNDLISSFPETIRHFENKMEVFKESKKSKNFTINLKIEKDFKFEKKSNWSVLFKC
jgi:hypothetical protein